MKRLTTAVLVIAWTVALVDAIPIRAEVTPDIQLLEGLRQRRLFSLAEFECHTQLARSDLDERQRAEWGVELLRTESRHALNVAPQLRAALWQKTHATAAKLLRSDPNSSCRVLVQVQDALTWLAEGQLMRLEAEIAPRREDALASARTTIRAATRRFEELDQQLTQKMSHHTAAQSTTELTENELFSLQNHVRFELARAYRNQALCYAADSNDRVAALSRALAQLKTTKNQLTAGDDLVWQLYLDEAICCRLLGSIEEARRALTAPLGNSAPTGVQVQAQAELIRLELAAGRPDDALELLKQIRRSGQSESPDIDFAEVETYVALWQAASATGDSAAAKQWQDKVTATVRYLETTHGAYWGRRGELLLLQAAGSAQSSDNVDILERTADDLYRKKRPGEAIAVYAKAADQAAASGARQRAFDLELKAALVEQGDKRYAAASTRLERLIQGHPENAKTPQADLMAIWNTAQSARTDAKALEQYVNLLEKHLTTWPLDPTTSTACLWLGRLRQSQQQWPEAIAAFQRVAHASPHFPEAVERAAQCWLNWLRELRKSDRLIEKDALAAATYFEAVIRNPGDKWPDRWTQAQQTAALTAARIRLAFTHDKSNQTLDLLDHAIQRNRSGSADWQNQTRLLRTVALAGRPESRNAARQDILRGRSDSLEHELDLVHMLGQLYCDTDDSRKEIAQLQLLALDRLKPSIKELDAAQRRTLGLLRAETLLTAGQNDQGIEAFQELAVEYPDDSVIQLRFAELLLDRREIASLRRALDQWRRIAQRFKPGTDDWYRAKYSIADAYFKLGDHAAAADRMRYLLATSNVEKSSWAKKVQELLAKCK